MSLEFYNDFFSTDIMNHCEFLKTLPELGKEDINLLKSIVGTISENANKKEIIPFYNNHQNLPKNIICILESYNLIKNLKAHEFNIFEYAFLAGGSEIKWEFSKDNNIKILSFFTLFFQYLILVILFLFNIPSSITFNLLVLIITFGTSFFFVKLAHNQYLHSTRFNKCYKLTGDPNKQIFLKMNFLSNVILPIIVPFFNFYYILLSEDPNNAILNSLALFFILELDSMILPSWPETLVNDQMVTNIHDYIMDGDNEDNKSPVIIKTNSQVKDIQYYDQKTYVSINKKDKIINFYVKENETSYITISYQVIGENSERFIDLIDDFDCRIEYFDIHD